MDAHFAFRTEIDAMNHNYNVEFKQLLDDINEKILETDTKTQEAGENVQRIFAEIGQMKSGQEYIPEELLFYHTWVVQQTINTEGNFSLFHDIFYRNFSIVDLKVDQPMRQTRTRIFWNHEKVYQLICFLKAFNGQPLNSYTPLIAKTMGLTCSQVNYKISNMKRYGISIDQWNKLKDKITKEELAIIGLRIST